MPDQIATTANNNVNDNVNNNADLLDDVSYNAQGIIDLPGDQ